MGRFKTVREAKDYLAGLIAEQAERECAPLTEVERQMLYFTESGGLTKAMTAVNEEFERDYDEVQYEERIGGLVSRLIAHNENNQVEQDWDDAVAKLSRGDHYLLILLDAAPSRSSLPWLKIPAGLKRWLPSPRPTNDTKDTLQLILLGFVMSAMLLTVIVVTIAIRDWFRR